MKLALVFCSLLSGFALADWAPYRGKKSIEDSTKTLVAKHSHDWSNPPHFDISTDPKAPFQETNKAAVLELWDKGAGKLIWKSPSPALTQVWISPDEKYVVGLSQIARANPYQLVVFRGQVSYSKRVTFLFSWRNFRRKNWMHFGSSILI